MANELTPAPVAPIPGWASPALTGIGMVGGAYASYLQSQQADREYQLILQAYREEQERTKRLDAANAQAQALQGSLAVGDYAQKQVSGAGQDYAAYARRLGL